jgi:hypothetical protein
LNTKIKTVEGDPDRNGLRHGRIILMISGISLDVYIIPRRKQVTNTMRTGKWHPHQHQIGKLHPLPLSRKRRLKDQVLI